MVTRKYTHTHIYYIYTHMHAYSPQCIRMAFCSNNIARHLYCHLCLVNYTFPYFSSKFTPWGNFSVPFLLRQSVLIFCYILLYTSVPFFLCTYTELKLYMYLCDLIDVYLPLVHELHECKDLVCFFHHCILSNLHMHSMKT